MGIPNIFTHFAISFKKSLKKKDTEDIKDNLKFICCYAPIVLIVLGVLVLSPQSSVSFFLFSLFSFFFP